MPPIISLISWFHSVMRLTSRWQPISGFRRWVNSGICVAMPQLQRPVWQERHRWQPSAISAEVAIYTASAPRAIALTTSALERIDPPTTRLTRSRMPSWRRRVSTAASASSIGMPTLSRMRVGAAPVPPRKPSMAIMSAPERAMPDAIAATLCTAAILTMTGFVYRDASLSEKTSWRRSSME